MDLLELSPPDDVKRSFQGVKTCAECIHELNPEK